ncbi:ERV2 protein-like protein [Metarhizium rileyi]|uniref:Sulfhydryl oxidase n=1 Tax=Metarhizium rileyi (strain RCEF 4871) TaxID=1649241 RepID=A0A166ZG30_METRR|nr:ERV2 protein-like protein [Metarhizium rileyi RCEF 4871]
MARRQHLTVTVLLVIIVLSAIAYLFSASSTFNPGERFRPGGDTGVPPTSDAKPGALSSTKPKPGFDIDLDGIPNLSKGDSIAPKLENATLKAELGQATWKFLHTMVSRFPEKPTDNDRKTLESFFQLFGRLYPCGDCARHFRAMLEKYPPQTSSRNAAAGWLCATHNIVNKRLNKTQFDCTKIGDFYDCGCGDDKNQTDKNEVAKGKTDETEKKVNRNEVGPVVLPALSS